MKKYMSTCTLVMLLKADVPFNLDALATASLYAAVSGITTIVIAMLTLSI